MGVEVKALVSVVMENFDAVRLALQAAGRPPPGLIGAPHPVPEVLVTAMGGRLLVLDLDAGKILEEHPLPTPSGLCWPDPDGPILVASMWHDALLVVDPGSGAVVRRLTHPAFNDLHTVVASEEGRVLLVSSGVDALVELELGEAGAHGRVELAEPTWGWWATGRPSPVPTARRPDPAADHRGRRYATLERALHLNSAMYRQDHVLTSSFHTGEILRINRDGRASTARAGLDHPHALVPAGPEGGVPPDSVLCCESPRGEIRVLRGGDLSDVQRLGAGLRWVQAACPSGRGTLLLLENPHFGAGRRGRGAARVLELDPATGTITTRVEVPAGWRLFGVQPLSTGQWDRLSRAPEAMKTDQHGLSPASAGPATLP